MVVLLVGIYSEGFVWLVREVRRVLRFLGVGSKMKNWVDCNTNPSCWNLLDIGEASIGKTRSYKLRQEEGTHRHI